MYGCGLVIFSNNKVLGLALAEDLTSHLQMKVVPRYLTPMPPKTPVSWPTHSQALSLPPYILDGARAPQVAQQERARKEERQAALVEFARTEEQER